jgi:hypothetical protein
MWQAKQNKNKLLPPKAFIEEEEVEFFAPVELLPKKGGGDRADAALTGEVHGACFEVFRQQVLFCDIHS